MVVSVKSAADTITTQVLMQLANKLGFVSGKTSKVTSKNIDLFQIRLEL